MIEFVGYEFRSDPESAWGDFDMREKATATVPGRETDGVSQRWWFTAKFFKNVNAMYHEKQVKSGIPASNYIPSSYGPGAGYVSREHFRDFLKTLETSKTPLKTPDETLQGEVGSADTPLVIRHCYTDGDIGCIMYDCSAVTLNELVVNLKEPLLLSQFKTICRQTVDILRHVHSSYVAHGNISSHSLRVQELMSSGTEVRLMGFEKSCYYSTFTSNEKFGEAVDEDINSLARVLFAVLYGSEAGAFETFLREPTSTNDGLLFAHLLKAMVRDDDKPTAEDISRHPFLLNEVDTTHLFRQLADGFLSQWPWSDVVSRNMGLQMLSKRFAWCNDAPNAIRNYLKRLNAQDQSLAHIEDFIELSQHMGVILVGGKADDRDITTLVQVRYFTDASSQKPKLGPVLSTYCNSVFDLIRFFRNMTEHYQTLGYQLQRTLVPMPGALSTYMAESFPMLLLLCYRTAFVCHMNVSPHYTNLFGEMTLASPVPGWRCDQGHTQAVVLEYNINGAETFK